MAVNFIDTNPNLFKNVSKDLKKLDKVLYKETAQLRNDIRDRTREGKDVDDKMFKRYSPDYRDRKVKAGRFMGFVNLTWFGHMLNTMSPQKIRGGGRIHFPNAAENNKATWNEKMGRKFFGFNKKQEQKILDNINKAIINGK